MHPELLIFYKKKIESCTAMHCQPSEVWILIIGPNPVASSLAIMHDAMSILVCFLSKGNITTGILLIDLETIWQYKSKESGYDKERAHQKVAGGQWILARPHRHQFDL